ncbi:thiamine diphosphokinase [Rhodovulum sp. DZ06]|uniref:thiamine diphosphokinase n=1 Tax=Rhodovulum sp. DZ06 TaxID=3425126 RepID=UPI003D346664
MIGDPAPLVYDAPLLLVGGAPFSSLALNAAHAALGGAAPVAAADGGADRLAALGRMPGAVIGDMDSVADAEAWRARLGDRFLHVAEQDSTDLQKCLRLTRAPLTLGVGFMDGRLDHTLAALTALVEARMAGRSVVLLGEEDCAAALPTRWSARVGAGARVSLYPLAPVRALGCAGLEWPAAGLDFAPAGRIGTSNRAAAEVVALETDAPGMVAVLPRTSLPALLESLAAGT